MTTAPGGALAENRRGFERPALRELGGKQDLLPCICDHAADHGLTGDAAILHPLARAAL
jgi:hypothetical protein